MRFPARELKRVEGKKLMVTPESLAGEPRRMEFPSIDTRTTGGNVRKGRFKEEIRKLTAHETGKWRWHRKENQLP